MPKVCKTFGPAIGSIVKRHLAIVNFKIGMAHRFFWAIAKNAKHFKEHYCHLPHFMPVSLFSGHSHPLYSLEFGRLDAKLFPLHLHREPPWSLN
jgi:hypothetical protein